MIKFIFIFKEDMTTDEWEHLISMCTLGGSGDPTTVIYDTKEDTLTYGAARFVDSISWRHATSYDHFKELALNCLMES